MVFTTDLFDAISIPRSFKIRYLQRIKIAKSRLPTTNPRRRVKGLVSGPVALNRGQDRIRPHAGAGGNYRNGEGAGADQRAEGGSAGLVVSGDHCSVLWTNSVLRHGMILAEGREGASRRCFELVDWTIRSLKTILVPLIGAWARSDDPRKSTKKEPQSSNEAHQFPPDTSVAVDSAQSFRRRACLWPYCFQSEFSTPKPILLAACVAFRL